MTGIAKHLRRPDDPAIALCLLLLARADLSAAGPPLSLEDPGILQPGQWEIITATTVTSINDLKYYQLPSLDVSLGVGDSMQVAASYPYVIADQETGGSHAEFGNIAMGFKWRFWTDEHLQIAFAPVYTFGVSRSLALQGVGNNTDILSLPLALEYHLGPRWRLNSSIVYDRVDEGSDEWSYGAAVTHTLNARWELMLELSAAVDTGFDSEFAKVLAGVDFAIHHDLHLLFSLATGLQEPSPAARLDYDVYLGLQFFY